MIANPIDAIGNSRTREELARVLEELMATWYPNGDKNGWESWSVTFKTLTIAKKAALRMYQRKLGG